MIGIPGRILYGAVQKNTIFNADAHLMLKLGGCRRVTLFDKPYQRYTRCQPEAMSLCRK